MFPRLRMGGGPVTCVYHAYDTGELIATGRLMLDAEPEVGTELRLNGRVLVVRDVVFSEGLARLTLETRQ